MVETLNIDFKKLRQSGITLKNDFMDWNQMTLNDEIIKKMQERFTAQYEDSFET